MIYLKHEEKTVKEVKLHKFLVCAYKSQDFVQSQKNFARSHDRETVTFRNSGPHTCVLHVVLGSQTSFLSCSVMSIN